MQKANELQIFNNEEFGEIRAINKDGEPWFIGKDVAESLGYIRTADAIRTHCKGVCEMATPSNGGTQTFKIIPEADLYRLIMRSKLESAERFQDWVCEEVLPAIRKTGTYAASMSYRAATKNLPSRSKIASDLQANLKIANFFGLEGNQALLSANKMTSNQYSEFGVNPLLECGVDLINEKNQQYFTPTQLGKHINTSANEINKNLTRAGFQESLRDHKNRLFYLVTDTGKDFCQIVDTGKTHNDGSPVQQVKWSMEVIPKIEPVSGTVN